MTSSGQPSAMSRAGAICQVIGACLCSGAVLAVAAGLVLLWPNEGNRMRGNEDTLLRLQVEERAADGEAGGQARRQIDLLETKLQEQHQETRRLKQSIYSLVGLLVLVPGLAIRSPAIGVGLLVGAAIVLACLVPAHAQLMVGGALVVVLVQLRRWIEKRRRRAVAL